MGFLSPWALYQKHLLCLGYGLPLWNPEPESDARRFEIGSVVCLTDDNSERYTHLFNSRRESDHPTNRPGGVPRSFVTFEPPQTLLTSPRSAFTQTVLASKTVRSLKTSADVGVAGDASGIPLGVSAGYTYSASDSSAAFLVVRQPCYSMRCDAKRRIVTYMRDNFALWQEFAKDKGLLAKEDHICFVSGVTLTTSWSTAVFQDDMTRSQEFHIELTGGPAGLGNINLSYEGSNQLAVTPHTNSGPSGDDSPEQMIDGFSRPVGTQCVFMHYYKMKRKASSLWRRLPEEMTAAAGPHELPPPGPDDHSGDPIYATSESSEDSDFEEVGSNHFDKWTDPVDILLTYILDNSEAEIAIGTDRDLIVLFKDTEFPEDVYKALADRHPEIDVDEESVGTVVVDIREPIAAERPITDPVEEGVSQGDAPYASFDTPGNVAPIIPLEGDTTEIAMQAEESRAGPSLHPAGTLDDEDMTSEERTLTSRREATQGDIWEPPANGHTGAVTSLAVSPNSKMVATGSDDTTIVVWDAEGHGVIHKWEAHSDAVWHLAFSPDNLRLASSGGDGRIMIWDAEKFELLATMEGHTETTHKVFWSPDGRKLASGSDDMTVRIWSGETYELLHLLEAHTGMITFVTFSPDGKLLASGGADYMCRLWDVETGEMLRELEGHKGVVWQGVFDPQGWRIATCSDDNSVRIWNVESGEELATLHEHQGPVWVVAFSPDGKEILSASSDSTVRVCDSFSSERRLALDGHDSMVSTASFSPNGKYVATGSSDNTVRLWKTSDGSCVATFNEHNDKVTVVEFSPDSKTLSSGSDDGTVRIRRLSELIPEEHGSG